MQITDYRLQITDYRLQITDYRFIYAHVHAWTKFLYFFQMSVVHRRVLHYCTLILIPVVRVPVPVHTTCSTTLHYYCVL